MQVQVAGASTLRKLNLETLDEHGGVYFVMDLNSWVSLWSLFGARLEVFFGSNIVFLSCLR